MIIPTVIANLATTGCAVLLLRRGPSQRLKRLTLTVGLMSLSQTASCIYHSFGTGAASAVPQVYQAIVACLSLLAIYLLSTEIYDRNYTDRKLRLLEHDVPPVVPAEVSAAGVATPLLALAAAHQAPAVPEPRLIRFYAGPDHRTVDAAAFDCCTADLLQLISVTGPSGQTRDENVWLEDAPLALAQSV